MYNWLVIKCWGREVLVISLFCLAAFLLGRRTAKIPEPEEIVRTDTITVCDTVRYDSLIYVKEKPVKPIYIPVTDTLRLHDTTYIVLERVQREYADTLFHAWVSGYEPELDSIHIFNKTQFITTTITKREPPKRWHVGLNAGYGVGKDGLSPYIGVGITYSLFDF